MIYDNNISIDSWLCRPGIGPGPSGLRCASVHRIERLAPPRCNPGHGSPVQTPPPTHAPVRAQQELPLEIPVPPQLIPLEEAQRWLGVSSETFARLLCTGQLSVVHVGRKLRSEDTVLLAWLTEHRPFRY